MNQLETIVKYIFLSLISLPILDMAFHFLPENVNNEKRDLKQDTSHVSRLNKIKNDLTSYDNNFSGRSMLVNLFINLQRKIPGNSPLPQKVCLGKEGFYYLVDYNCMDDYRNVSRWKPMELENLVLKLENNQKRLDSLGIPYVITVVPEKQQIYPEYLPDYITKIEGPSRMEQFLDYIKSHQSKLNVIDLSNVILKNKKKESLYFKKDSHWNYYGAYLGFTTVMNYLHEKFKYEYDSTRVYKQVLEDENDLDLAKVMGESFYSTEKVIKLHPETPIKLENFNPGFEISDYIKRRKPDFVIGKTNPLGKKKLFMFRDSYTALWSDYFSNEFNQSVFVWKYTFDMDMILKFKPDIVIQEVAQRHLEYLNKQ